MTEAPSILTRLRRVLGRVPGVLRLRRGAYARAFASHENVNLYRGVFDTFEQAALSAPNTKPPGYDNEASARMYDDVMEPTLRDYPAMFWLQRAFLDGHERVFDLGGHVGIKYYAFSGRMQMPTQLRWRVCDVPAVVARGNALAIEKGTAETLRFTADWRDLSAADVLFASGSIQYLPVSLGDMLRALPTRPARLVINSAALHPTRSFFTLNSIGVSFCPYRVQSEPSFMDDMNALGYRCVDRWETPRDFAIPFEPGYEMDRFVGLAFTR